MKEVADGVWHLSGFPPNNRNVYVLGDVLVDSGIALDRRTVMRQIRGREIRAHAVTHAHFDHYGSSHAICTELGIPLWCGERDADAIEAGKMVIRGGRTMPGAKGHPVARRLKEGDDVAGFAVLDVPGHSPGHVAFWRESDRVLVCGDVMWNQNPYLAAGGLREPFPVVSPDPALNRESARRLAALDAALILFGHGGPMRDAAAFRAVVAKLPS